jgi:hypothetical protein
MCLLCASLTYVRIVSWCFLRRLIQPLRMYFKKKNLLEWADAQVFCDRLIDFYLFLKQASIRFVTFIY